MTRRDWIIVSVAALVGILLLTRAHGACCAACAGGGGPKLLPPVPNKPKGARDCSTPFACGR